MKSEERITLRVTNEQKIILKKLSRDTGLTLSSYLRMRGLSSFNKLNK